MAIAVGLSVPFWRRSAQADLRPIPHQNVLLVTIDTLRADALGCDGGPARTPALDRLASEGVRFTFAHAQAVLTLPSHTTIMTGEYPYQHGVRENSGYRLAAGTPTIATLLKKAGYATGAFVGAFPLHSRFGLNAGFDVYDDRFGETREPTEFVMPERPASAVVPLARAWLAARERDRGTPFFEWVHVFDPHAPYQPPPPFDREYAGRPYYGEVAAVDAALAPLFDDLRAAPDPTIVVVTGDHGEALGDHGEATHGLFAYESTLRIPLIIAELGGGRRATPTEVSNVPVRHIDLLPTLLDAAGVPVPSGLPGRSLLAAAERRTGAPPRPSYFEAMSAMLNRGWAPLTGILSGRDKLIDLPIPELYDLGKDPAEATNLIDRAPVVARTLEAALRAFGAGLPGARVPENAEALARLRALGYVAGDAPRKATYTEADDPKRLIEVDQAIHTGIDLYEHRQFVQAEQVYKGILARRPDMALAYRHLAFVYWETGQVKEAIATLQQALKAGVRHESVTAQLGMYLAESGDAADAVRLLEPIASAATADLDTVNALGIAYARSGHAADARTAFERMLTEDPANPMALENLGTIDLERGDFAAARQRFEKAVAVDPTASQAYAGLGVVAMKGGDRKAAVDAWRQAVVLDATNFDALYNLAATLLEDGERQAALPYLEQFVRTAPPAFYGKDIREFSAVLQSR